MDITRYAARNQIAHQRLLAAALAIATVVPISEQDMDILKHIKAQDNDVHSLYQREAVANVLEAVVAHFGGASTPEPASKPTETPAEPTPEETPASELAESPVEPDEPAPAPTRGKKHKASKNK